MNKNKTGKPTTSLTWTLRLLAALLLALVFTGIIVPVTSIADYEDGMECGYCGAYRWDNYLCGMCGCCSEEGDPDCWARTHCEWCGSCFSNNETDFCGESALCIECLVADGWHCPDCNICYCGDRDGNLCTVCFRCDSCSGGLCPDCGMCDECANEEGDVFHCKECGVCIESGAEFCQVEENSDHCVDCHQICEACDRCSIIDGLEFCSHCDLCMECCLERAEMEGCTCGEYCVEDSAFLEHLCDNCGACYDNIDQCGICGFCLDCCEMNSECSDHMCSLDPEYEDHFCTECGQCFHEVEQCGSCEDGGEIRCIDCCRVEALYLGCDCGDWCSMDPDFFDHLDDEHDDFVYVEHTQAQPMSTYRHNATNHWRECVHCNWSAHYTDYNQHTYDSHGTCTVCGYQTDVDLHFLTEPKDVHVKYEDDKEKTRTFSVVAYGTGSLTYQWYYGWGSEAKNGTGVVLSGAKTNRLTVSVAEDVCESEYSFYCVVKDKTGKAITSRTAQLIGSHNYWNVTQVLKSTGLFITWENGSTTHVYDSDGHRFLCACGETKNRGGNEVIEPHSFGPMVYWGKTPGGKEFYKRTCTKCGYVTAIEKHEHVFDGANMDYIDVDRTTDLYHVLKCTVQDCDHTFEEPHTWLLHVYGGYPLQLNSGHGSVAFHCIDCDRELDLVQYDESGNRVWWTSSNYVCDTESGVLSNHIFEKSDTLTIDPYTSDYLRKSRTAQFAETKVTGWKAVYSWADSSSYKNDVDCTSSFTFAKQADGTWTVKMKSTASVPGGSIVHFTATRTACTHDSGTKLLGRKEPVCNLPGYTGDTVCKECFKLIKVGSPIAPVGTEHEGILKYITGTAVTGSCTTRGFEGYYRCSVCNQRVAGDYTGYQHGTLTVRDQVASTCTTDGYSGDKYCNTCGKIAQHGHVIKAHHTGLTITGAVDATTTSYGYTGDIKCRNCGAVVRYGHNTPMIHAVESGYIKFAVPKEGDTVSEASRPKISQISSTITCVMRSWKYNGQGIDEFKTFKDGREYTAEFWIAANAGYGITNDTVIRINGQDCSCSGRAKKDGVFIYLYKLTFQPVHIIREIWLNFGIPIEGDPIAAPAFTLQEDKMDPAEAEVIRLFTKYSHWYYTSDRYTYDRDREYLKVNGLSGYTDGAVFKAGDKYLAGLAVQAYDWPQDEYNRVALGSLTKYYVNGNEVSSTAGYTALNRNDGIRQVLVPVPVEAFKFTTQPVNIKAEPGEMVMFYSKANGSGTTYQWYQRENTGASWSKVSGAAGTKASYTMTAAEQYNGYQYYCLATSASGKTVKSNTVTLKVGGSPVITSQSEDVTVTAGKTAKFTVEALGDDLTYQWYYSKDKGSTWTAVSAASGKTAAYSLTVQEKHNGYRYKCTVTNDLGSVTSRVVTLTVNAAVTAPVITTQPKSVTVTAGKTAKFTVTATGADSYQWWYRTSSAGTWKAVSAASGKTAAYSLTAQEKHNGYQYKCVLTNAGGETTTNIVKLTVNAAGAAPAITTQPKNKTVNEGKTAKFTVAASGEELTYQWWYRTSSTGTWKAVSAASGKTAAYSLTAKAKHDGYQYKCVVSNAAGSVTSKIVTLTVNKKPVITTQPKNVSVTAGKTAKFTVKATEGELTYQWYYSKDKGKTWTAVSSASGKKATYSLTAKAKHNGYQYYCQVTNAVGSTKTNTVTLTVK